MLRLSLMGIKVVYYGDLGSLISPISEEAAVGIICREGWYSEEHGLNFYRANASSEFPIYVWQDHQALNRFLLHFGSCTFIDATGAPLSKQRLRSLRVDHCILADLFEREENKLLEHYDLAAAYADRLFNGSWDEFVRRVYSNPEFAFEQAKVVGCEHSKALEEVIIRSPIVASRYAKTVLQGRWLEAEPTISADAEAAVYYATLVLKRRWHEAEEVISRDPVQAARYSLLVRRDRWDEAEDVILEDFDAAWSYLTNVRGKRWEKAEGLIAKSPVHAAEYARDFLEGKWPHAEATISSDAEASLIYARDVLKKPWKAGEKAILSDPVVSAKYAYQVLKGPWKEAEAAILSSPEASYRYALKALKRQRSDAFEGTIITAPMWAFSYALDVIGERWYEAEPSIMAEPDIWDRYQKAFGVFDLGTFAMAS